MGLNSKSGCSSKQTFCALGYETVSLMMEQDTELKNQINNLPSYMQGDLINPTLYDKIKEILIYIKNFGKEGTRNPTQDEINTINDEIQHEIIYYNNYNNILKILQQSNILSNNNILISKEIMDNLKNYIKEYKFNNDRCNYCNVKGNTGSGCHPFAEMGDDSQPTPYTICTGCLAACQNVDVCPECSSGSENY